MDRNQQQAGLRTFFNKPHPFIFNRGSLLIPFLITFLVIVIFQPFGFARSSASDRVIWALVFGLLVAGCVGGVVKSLQLFFPEIMQAENWTLGKEILLVLLVVVVICLVVFTLFWWYNPTVNVVYLWRLVVVRTVLISIFPVLFLVLYEQFYHQKEKWKEAQRLNEELQNQQRRWQSAMPVIRKQGDATKILFTDENEKMALQLPTADLLFLKAEGNYVEVFYRHDMKMEKELIRNRLKYLAEQLPAETFFRCHKSYVVNLRAIAKVEGNARNLELVLQNWEGRIPVSRTKSRALAELLHVPF